MGTLNTILLEYAIGITIGFVIVLISRIRYKKLSEELKKQIDMTKVNGMPGNQPQQQVQQIPYTQMQGGIQPQQQPMPMQPVQNPMPMPQPMQPAQAQFRTQAFVPPVQPPIQPQVQPQVRPQVTAEKPEPQKTKISAIGVVFAVGVLLLLVSAAVFLTASWQTLDPVAKCAVLGSATLLVMGMSVVFKKVLKLEKTSMAFYSLGCLLIPVTLLAGYLSFGFDRIFMLLILCAISLAITGALGYFIYKSKLHAAISYLGLIWLSVFICSEVIGDEEGFIFGLSFGCLLAGLVGFFVKDKVISIISEVISYLAIVVFFLCYMIPLPWQLISMILCTAAFALCFKKRKFIMAVMPVLVVIIGVTSLCQFYDNVRIDHKPLMVIGLTLTTVFAAGYLLAAKFLKIASPFSNAYILAGSLAAGVASSIMVDAFPEFVMIPAVITAFLILILSKNKIEKIVYWPLLALTVLIESFCLEGLFHVALLVLAIYAAVYVYSLFSGNYAANGSFAIIAMIAFPAFGMFIDFYFFLAVPVALYIMTVIIQRKKPLNDLPYHIFRAGLSLVFAVTAFIVIDKLHDHPTYLIAIVLGASVAFLVTSLFDPKDRFAGAVPSLVIPVALYWLYLTLTLDFFLAAPLNYAIFILAIVLSAVAGRIIYRSFFSKKHFDFIMLFSLVYIVAGYIAKVNFFALLSVFIICLIGGFGKEGQSVRERILTYIKPILSLFTLSLAFTFINTDIEAIDDTVLYQLRLLAFLIAAAVICFVIRLTGRKWIWFASLAIVLQVEIMIAFMTRELLPLSVVFALAIAVTVYSFIGKRKSYLILGVVSLIESVVGLSTIYWQNRYWWAYLLVAGVALISLASVNEYKRRKAAESGAEEKKIMLFENWTW